MEDWAEVHRLSHREGLSKAAIARRLGMSRNTGARLLELGGSPSYIRAPGGSQLDPFAEAIAAMLDTDPKAPATVIREHLRALGYRGGISIPKEHLARERPGSFSAWAEIFGDPVAVAAMVDRLVHHAEVSVLKGDSYRRRGKGEEVLSGPRQR